MTARSEVPVVVAPEIDPRVVEAVDRGGGRVVDDPAEARALVWTGPKDASIRDYLTPAIEWVQLPSAGVEAWVTADVIDDGRTWTSATGAYAAHVAEHALALLLACSHRLPAHATATTWTKLVYRPLGDSVIAVLGAGGIGSALIEVLLPLGVRTVAVNRSGRPVHKAHETSRVADLDDVLQRSDHLVLALPSTAETLHLLDRRRLRLLRPHSVVVNVGRGDAIDHDSLLAALDDASIGYTGLDVTEPEPLPDGHPLWSHPRVLITSHSANPPEALALGLAERVRVNVQRFAEGRPLVGVIDRHRGY